jgi:hypothetical protein
MFDTYPSLPPLPPSTNYPHSNPGSGTPRLFADGSLLGLAAVFCESDPPKPRVDNPLQLARLAGDLEADLKGILVGVPVVPLRVIRIVEGDGVRSRTLRLAVVTGIMAALRPRVVCGDC